jgi:serine/threonine-protein kinase
MEATAVSQTREVGDRIRTALADRYRVEGEIGQGGMATVYLAHDLKHDRRVALKVLRSELTAGLGAERFVQEIGIAAKLSHPHILPLFDSGEADGLLYYVMPYVEGESLDDRLAREGRLSAEEAVRLTDQIASALTYAHERGVVHRDIKPGNILLAGDQAVVADFGIARAVAAASADRLTGSGTVVGTPAYMAPEQALGDGSVDGRTDVYGLGCVVFEMLTGEPPFKGKDPAALLAMRLSDASVSLRESDPALPLFLDRAVSRALATDPDQRFPRAADFAEALTTGRVVQQVRRRTRRTGLAWVAGIASVALLAWLITSWLQAPRMGSLAVLPFADLTGDPEQAFLAAGVHEELIAELGRLDLKTISRATMARFRDSEQGTSEIARELGVDGVVEGSVVVDGDSLAISARLYDRNEEVVWAGSFEGVLPDLVALYRGFARAIAEEIRLRLTPEDEARLAQEPAVNPAVYEPYLRGKTVLQTAITPAEIQRAIDYFNQAIAADPADAMAWAGLAECYVTLGHNTLVSDPEIWSLGRAAALRAIRMDSTSAEGWAALANYETYWGRDWEAAERAFHKAHGLNANLAWNHYHYAWYLMLFGRVEEALVEHRLAAELDPLTPSHTTWLPAVHWGNQDFQTAYEESKAQVEGAYADDFFANRVLAKSAAYSGHHEQAIAAAVEYRELGGGVRMLALTHALAGNTEEALALVEWLEQYKPMSSALASVLAEIHAALGNREKTFEWLEWEPPKFSLPWVIFYPPMDAFREDPRFQALFRKHNLALEPGRIAPVPLPPQQRNLPEARPGG